MPGPARSTRQSRPGKRLTPKPKKSITKPIRPLSRRDMAGYKTNYQMPMR